MKGVLYTLILFGVLLSEVTGDVNHRIFVYRDEKDQNVVNSEETGDVLEADDISYDGEDIHEILERDEESLLTNSFEENSNSVKIDDDINIIPHLSRDDNKFVSLNINQDDNDKDYGYDYIDDVSNLVDDQPSNHNEVNIDRLTDTENDLDNKIPEHFFNDSYEDIDTENIEADEFDFDYFKDFNDFYNKQAEITENKKKKIGTVYKYSSKDREIQLKPRKKVRRRYRKEEVAGNAARKLSPSVYSTSNYFQCMDHSETSALIFYGTKGWTFPIQDVNLTLSYPIPKSSEPAKFWITGFRVMVHIDGAETRGCIARGGVLLDNITLTFVNRGITTLMYRFWLFGTPKSAMDDREISSKSFVCN